MEEPVLSHVSCSFFISSDVMVCKIQTRERITNPYAIGSQIPNTTKLLAIISGMLKMESEPSSFVISEHIRNRYKYIDLIFN